MRGGHLARGHMRHPVDAIVLFDDALQVARRIGVCLRQAQSPRAQLGAEPAVLHMAAQVDELAHQQPPVIIAASDVPQGAFERVMRGPRNLHEFVCALAEIQVAYADTAILALRGDATMGFARFRRSGTHKKLAMRELGTGDPLDERVA